MREREMRARELLCVVAGLAFCIAVPRADIISRLTIVNAHGCGQRVTWHSRGLVTCIIVRADPR